MEGKPGTDWKIPTFIKEYDGVINSFKNAGYEENKDLFVFPYDWRKNLDNLAVDLNSFVTANNLVDKKINFVGHSMGGLVARTYLQKYNNPNVNKVIMAGSPNKGIVDAYGMWEGATVWNGAWWQNVLVEIATETNRQLGESKIQSVRRIAPSIKDLMPTESFLTQGSTQKPWTGMFWKNTFLNTKNSEVTPFLEKLFAGASDDYSNTKSGIYVEKPSTLDNLQGVWVDGKPKSENAFQYSTGDGYVNFNSAQGLFDKKIEFTGGHGETISKKENIEKILAELNISTTSAMGSDFETRKNVFVAKLNSPGKLHVCILLVCDSSLGLEFTAEKMIIIPGYNKETLSISVESDGETGKYQLLLGEINNTGEWKKIFGKLNLPGQVDNYYYTGTNGVITGDSVTTDRLVKYFWPKKIKFSEVDDLREKILKDIDKNIKLKNTTDFDVNIAKWQAMDFYVSSLKKVEKKDEHHESHAERSKYISKTSNYYSATLAELIEEKESALKLIPKWSYWLRTDKHNQINMLQQFMGLKK